MACRVGMTTNPGERKRHWERRHPTLWNWNILERNLTYDQALRKEEESARRYGCQQSGGGERVSGSNYVVYKFDY